MVENTSDELAHRFFRLLVPSLFSSESPELSLLHFLFYVKSGTSLESLMTTTGGAQESRVVGGTHLISERMAEALGESVRLNAVVRTIRQDESGVVVEYEGGSLTAGHVIVAIPQTLAGRLRYDPPLPALGDGLTQQMPAGAVIKFQVGYDTPFWREEGLSGTVWSIDDPFNVVLDNSPRDGSCGVLVGFLEGHHARTASPLSEAERRALVVADLVKYFGPKAAEPFDIVEEDWTTEEFTRGCYGGRLGAGAWTQYGTALAAPVGRSDPLGRGGDLVRLERLHGRGRAFRSSGSRRNPSRHAELRPPVAAKRRHRQDLQPNPRGRSSRKQSPRVPGFKELRYGSRELFCLWKLKALK